MLCIDNIASELLELQVPATVLFSMFFTLFFLASLVEAVDIFVGIVALSLGHLRSLITLFVICLAPTKFLIILSRFLLCFVSNFT